VVDFAGGHLNKKQPIWQEVELKKSAYSGLPSSGIKWGACGLNLRPIALEASAACMLESGR
jgi:hypothetical protein